MAKTNMPAPYRTVRGLTWKGWAGRAGGAILAGLAILLAFPGVEYGRQIQDHGTFTILVGGKAEGTESFTIRATKDSVEATDETQLTTGEGEKQVQFHSASDLVLDPELRPQTYSWKQAGPPPSSLRINFGSSPAKVEYHTVDGKTDLRQFELPKDLAVLDDNVFCHYQILLDLYRQSGDRAMTFTAFIPQEALPGQLRIEKTGEDKIEIAGRKIKATRYSVTTDMAHIDLWADKDGRLQRISMPAAQLTAERQ